LKINFVVFSLMQVFDNWYNHQVLLDYKHYICCSWVMAYLLEWIVTQKIKLSKNKSHCLRKTLGKHYYTRWKAKLFELRSRKVIDDRIIFQITESEYHKLCVNRLIRMHRCGNVVNILNTRDSGKRLYFIPFVSRWAVFIPEIILVLIIYNVRV